MASLTQLAVQRDPSYLYEALSLSAAGKTALRVNVPETLVFRDVRTARPVAAVAVSTMARWRQLAALLWRRSAAPPWRARHGLAPPLSPWIPRAPFSPPLPLDAAPHPPHPHTGPRPPPPP